MPSCYKYVCWCQLCVCVCVCPHALQSNRKRQRALEVAGPCAVNHTFGLTDESEVPLSHLPTHSRPLRTALGHSLTLRLAVFHSFCLYAFRFPPFFFVSVTTCVSTSACCLQFVSALFFSLSQPLSLFVFQLISSLLFLWQIGASNLS